MITGRFWLGLSLTAVAGAIDAISFARFGAIYASFMSGNTVQLGLHVGLGEPGPLGIVAPPIICFMLGGFVGSLTVAKLRGGAELAAILGLETVAVALAFGVDRAGGPLVPTAAALSFAMGAQNTLVVLVRGANPGTTFVTGTAFRFADAVAQRVLGRDPAGAWRLHLAVWMSFAVGAALGAICEEELHNAALAPILAVLAGATVIALVGLGRRAGATGL